MVQSYRVLSWIDLCVCSIRVGSSRNSILCNKELNPSGMDIVPCECRVILHFRLLLVKYATKPVLRHEKNGRSGVCDRAIEANCGIHYYLDRNRALQEST